MRGSEYHELFSSDYVIARQKFLTAAEAASAEMSCLQISELGPSEEPLSIDIAYIGPKSPKQLLIHTSGLHGVEGFPGSAVQISLLNRISSDTITLPDKTGILIAHAINPWGFAWLRRVNENNADLNRNFLPPGEAYAGEPVNYAELNGLLNPETHLTPFDFFRARSMLKIFKMGFNVAKQTVAEGQYERPKAMQFGGAELYESPRLWLGHLNKILDSIERAVIIDFHTGLGPFGVDSLLVSDEEGDAALTSLKQRYGERIQPLDPDAGVAYRIRGGMLSGISARWPEVDWTLITQEFGTVKPVQVIKSLRAENRMTQWSGLPPLKQFHSNERRQLVKVFSPSSDEWRGMILSRGEALIDDALSDLDSKN
jgi:hypothetical protein